MSFKTPKQIAEIIGMSENHVKNMIRSGELPGYKFNGTRYRVEESDFQTWLANQKLSKKGEKENE